MNVTELARGLRFPEGPIVMPDGSVILVEIERQCLSRVDTDGTVTVIAQLGGGPNGAAIGPDGCCYVCNNGGFLWRESREAGLRPHGVPDDYSGGRIERVDLGTGEVTTLYDRCGDRPLRGPNDIVFDKQGGFWFTDLGKGREREMERGGVYYAKADGSSIREVIYPLITPNGIGLSADETRLYVAETYTGRLWGFDVAAPGEVALKPWPASPNGGDLLYGAPGYQLFDSLAVDGEGNVCVATVSNGGITVVSPDGQNVEHVPMPDPVTTNICFGGSDLRTAYITLSSTGRLVTVDWPRPGLPLNF
jgi:gluconolactonase